MRGDEGKFSTIELSQFSLSLSSLRCQMQGKNPGGGDPRQEAFLHMQPPVSMETGSSSSSSLPWDSRVEVRCYGPCAPSDLRHPPPHQQDHSTDTITRSLRRPSRRTSRSSPPPFRSCSIPIIPSVQCHHNNETSCMQTSVVPAAASVSSAVPAACFGPVPRREAVEQGRREGAAQRGGQLSSSCSSAIGQQQDEVALLLEDAQEQLRALALAHRKQEEGGLGAGGSGSMAISVEARDTVCFLSSSGGGAGGLSCHGLTETQLLSPNPSHRDSVQTGQ